MRALERIKRPVGKTALARFSPRFTITYRSDRRNNYQRRQSQFASKSADTCVQPDLQALGVDIISTANVHFSNRKSRRILVDKQHAHSVLAAGASHYCRDENVGIPRRSVSGWWSGVVLIVDVIKSEIRNKMIGIITSKYKWR